MNDWEEKLHKAAGLYTEKEGEALLAETQEIRRQNVSYMTPRADKTVKDLMAKEKRPKQRKAVFGLCAAAACIVFTIALINIAPGSMSGGSGANMAADTGVSEASPAPAAETESGAPVPIPEGMVPISFVMPSDYYVENAELDNGLSVYSLESDMYGGVVLTMYYEGGGPGEGYYADFDEVLIDGTAVPAKVRDTYRLLAFDFDGMYYTLSSEDDLGSLAAFYRNIKNYSRDL